MGGRQTNSQHCAGGCPQLRSEGEGGRGRAGSCATQTAFVHLDSLYDPNFGIDKGAGIIQNYFLAAAHKRTGRSGASVQPEQCVNSPIAQSAESRQGRD
jgi:hypothetical protein